MIEPPATLDTVITIEWFLAGGVALALAGLGWIFLDMRKGRQRTYDKLDAITAAVTTEFKAVRQEIKEQGDVQAAVLRNHEEGCNKRAEADARWKGRVEGRLGIDKED